MQTFKNQGIPLFTYWMDARKERREGGRVDDGLIRQVEGFGEVCRWMGGWVGGWMSE